MPVVMFVNGEATDELSRWLEGAGMESAGPWPVEPKSCTQLCACVDEETETPLIIESSIPLPLRVLDPATALASVPVRDSASLPRAGPGGDGAAFDEEAIPRSTLDDRLDSDGGGLGE